MANEKFDFHPNPRTVQPYVMEELTATIRWAQGVPSALRGWQPKGFNVMKLARLSLLIAICGSGKTMLLLILAAYRFITSNMTQRQLIAVPQSHIGRGFTLDELGGKKGRRICVNGAEYNWKIRNNFCDASSQDVINKLKEFICTQASRSWREQVLRTGLIQEGIAVTTHAALTMAIKQLRKELSPGDLRRAFHKLTLTVDEAHHIQGIFDDMETTDTMANNLGALCRFIVNLKDDAGNPDATAQLCLATQSSEEIPSPKTYPPENWVPLPLFSVGPVHIPENPNRFCLG